MTTVSGPVIVKKLEVAEHDGVIPWSLAKEYPGYETRVKVCDAGTVTVKFVAPTAIVVATEPADIV